MKTYLVLVLSFILLFTACGGNTGDEPADGGEAPPPVDTGGDTGSDEIRLQDDFYAAVNAEWLSTTAIPDDKYTVGGFADLQYDIEELLMADFAVMTEDKAAEFECLSEFLKFYAMTSDYDTRNSQGTEPLAPYLAQIEALKSLADLNAALPDIVLRGALATPVDCGVSVDFEDARFNALFFTEPSLFLPDMSYYDTPTGDYLFEILSQVFFESLKLCGYKDEDATRISEQAIAFDALIKPYMRPSEEAREVDKMNNPKSLSEFTAYSSALDLYGLVNYLTPAVPEKVIVVNPKYYEALDKIITEESFPLLKSWMTVRTIVKHADMLSQDLYIVNAQYFMVITGVDELEDPRYPAYRLAGQYFSEPVGIYYAKTYFGDEARQDVISMTEKLIEVYKGRIGSINWLGEETVQAALRKLDSMSLQIGYPDNVNEVYALFKVVSTEEGGTVLSNIMEFDRLVREDNFAKCGKETDKTEWLDGAATVNAWYNSQANTITFPAAILQEPFYSPDYSASRNFGGIGAVIGHEITHAFDPMGSMFDENGSLRDWWTETDHAAFEKRTEALKAQFDGVPYLGVEINGRQVVTEVVGDAGGLSAALEVCESLPNADLCAFFEGFATIFREIVRPEVAELYITTSAYPPGEMRVNYQVRNLDAFYTAFSVKEGDGMYLAPADRASVW